jgi:hypothetical protein
MDQIQFDNLITRFATAVERALARLMYGGRLEKLTGDGALGSLLPPRGLPNG